MMKEGYSGVVTPPWLDEFRAAVERYYRNPPEDPFASVFVIGGPREVSSMIDMRLR